MTHAARAASDSDALVLDEQIRQHRLTLPAAVAGSALLGLIVAIVQSRVIGVGPAAGWLLALALVSAGRIWLYLRHERVDPDHWQAAVWIGRYRLLSLAHGLVWAGTCLVLFPNRDLAHQLFLVFALAGICVCSLSGYAFDLRAAVSFCVPVLLATLVRLLMLGTDTAVMMSAIGVLLIVYVLAVALRANRTMREAVALRGAEAVQLAELHRSHGQLQRAEALAGLGSFVFDCASADLRWSDGHFRVWGLTAGSVVPDRHAFLAGVHPDDRERVATVLQRTIDTGAAVDCRYRICRPDGGVRHVLGHSEVQFDAQGRVLAVTGTVQDVTCQTLTQASLMEKQQLLSVMQQTTQLGFWFVDGVGRTTGVNPAVAVMLARPDDALLGESILDSVDPAYARRLRLALSGADRSDEPATLVQVLRADGGAVRCLAHHTALVNPAGQVTGLLVMLSDLSAVERAREAQHVSEFIVNSVHDMVSVIDPDGYYRFVNDAWCARNGMQRDAVVGSAIVDRIPAVMTDRRAEAFRACIEHRQLQVVRAEVDYPVLGRRTMETTMTPYLTSDTQVRGAVAVTRDVTEQEATRAALAQSLDNLQRIFNATTDGMFAYDPADPEGRLLFANDRFFQMWHMPIRPAQEVTRRDVLAAASRLFVDPAQEVARINAILATDEPSVDRHALRDGRVIERHGVPMAHPSGPTRVWVFRDVTLQEQAASALRANEGQQRALMDAFPGYVSVIDQDFVYTYVSASMAALFSRTPESLVGRHMRDLLGEQNFLRNAEIIAQLKTGQRVTVERLYEATAERPAVYLQMTMVMGAKGSQTLQRFYAFGIDITELKHAEVALRATKEDAERANRAKSAFLASVSHELRTPLNAILGFSQLLRADAQASPAASDNAGEIERAGRHLLALVDDLIDLGGVEAGQLELTMQRVAVETVINDSLSMVAPLAANQGIRIVFEGGDARNAVVLADAVRLRQVIINLLSNAIKYNRPDGSVRVSCRRHPSNEEDHHRASIRIAVTDTGDGIAPEMAGRVFSAFERLGAERGAVEGTGIGLSIARRLVSAMGGSIGYESRVHEGSTFWIDLPPLAPVTEKGAAAKAIASPRAAQPLLYRADHPRILVAEDYGPNQAVLQQQLSTLGCKVDIVSDGLEALAHRDAAVYDLILTDLDMPRMGGHALARAIREREAQGARRVPIVAISAAVVAGERARCIAAGMDDMLTKPIALEALAAMLARWLLTSPPVDAKRPVPATSEPAVAGSAAPVLDLDALYAVLGRVSSTQAGQLLATFIDTAEEGLQRLAGPEPDPAALVREMHRQQSSAQTVGALRYAQLAQA
ncbi:MAG: PAS domain-containing protein, partial [Burkholderiaceae bacterium]